MDVSAKPRRWTRAEYERMIDAGIFNPDERAELIGGEIIAVAPQKSLHATAVSLAHGTLERAFGPEYHVRVQLPLALDPDSEPEPDVAVVPGSPRDYLHAHPSRSPLVVEAADTTLALDRHVKGSLYARGGLADYWIVNLVERVLEVYRDPAPDPAAPYGWAYRTVDRLGPEAVVQPLAAPGTHIAVADLLP